MSKPAYFPPLKITWHCAGFGRPASEQLFGMIKLNDAPSPGYPVILEAMLPAAAALDRNWGLSYHAVAKLAVLFRRVSYEKKKNNLFRLIGPPTLPAH